MKALLLRAPNDFAVVERPDPEPQADEALVRIRWTGICATDVATIEGHSTVAAYPLTPGHEFVGTIDSAPAGCGFGRDDWVTIYPTQGCGSCGACLAGTPNFCRRFRVFGIHRDGGSFAELMSVPVRHLIAVPPQLCNATGALIEPVAVAVHANRRAGVTSAVRRRIAVIGAGVVGVLVAQVARAHGAEGIVLVDRMPSRRRLCAELGFESFVPVGQGDFAADLAAAGPFDLVFDNACTRETIGAAVEALDPGGTLVLLGFPHGGEDLPLAYAKAYKWELSVLLSRNYAPADFADAIALLQRGRIDAERMVTGVWPLDEFDRAYASLRQQPDRHVKVMLQPG